MRSSLHRTYDRTTEIDRQECRYPDADGGDEIFIGIAKLLLWPDNTAPNLAAACGCSVRQAERYLAGQPWSGDAVAAVMQKILTRRGVRNLRVRSR